MGCSSQCFFPTRVCLTAIASLVWMRYIWGRVSIDRSLIHRTYAVAPQTVVGAGFFLDFSLVAQSLDKPALTGFFILKCVSPDTAMILAKPAPTRGIPRSREKRYIRSAIGSTQLFNNGLIDLSNCGRFRKETTRSQGDRGVPIFWQFRCRQD
jgi:hypothetical protein